MLPFICSGCADGIHAPCKSRNLGKPTPDCDCQHRPDGRKT